VSRTLVLRWALGGALACNGLGWAQTPASPVTVSAVTPDVAAGTLVIAGTGFGLRPLVTLDLVPLTLRTVGPTAIDAAAPLSLMPAGRYLLTVSRGPASDDTASIPVTLHGGPATATDRSPVTTSTLGSATDAAALVGDTAITVAEVDREWQRTDPAGYVATMKRVYEARRRALQTLVTSAVLAQEAAAQQVSTEALLAAEVPKRRVPLPDVAVSAVYQSLGDRARGVTLDALTPAIRAWLADVTEPELAKMSYVEELRKVATRVEVRLAAPRLRIDIGPTDPSIGPPEAPVQLVVFADLQSVEYIGMARALPRILQTFGARLRVVFKHLPTGGVLAETSARAAACADAQGRFWPFHDAVVTTPGFLDTPRLKRVAAESGLASAGFDACLDGDEHRDLPQRAMTEAARYAITTSPTLVANGVQAPPAPAFLPPFEYLQRLIEETLAAHAAPPPGRQR
jgi:protein-disulfide isomerase